MKKRRRDLSQVRDLSRIPFLSYAQKSADPRRPRRDDELPVRHNTIRAFLPQNLMQWITSYFRNRFGPRHDFQEYTGADRGIYRLDGDGDAVRISLVGDWATGTEEANDVAGQVEAFHPHYTIHLGDVYYVGDATEVRGNCLGQPVTGYEPCTWPHGSKGSFALNGNHEMYARGNAYFDLFLPTVGIRGGAGQGASFFCLENDHWLVIALDTGYNSIGLPVLENIPIWPFKPDCALRREQLTWLSEEVLPGRSGRGVVLLSHHQYFSSFEGGYPKAAKQLRALIDRPVLWWWGHEHRMAIYEKESVEGGIEAYGRCIGHGGMPVELKEPQGNQDRLVFTDAREYPNEENLVIGYNGFANLTFLGDTLVVNYADLTGHVVFTESWRVANGVLVQLSSGLPAPGPLRPEG